MTLDEIREAKHAAEAAIQTVLVELQAKTQLCPRAVSFDLVDVTTLVDDGRRLLIGSVRIELELI